MLETYAYMEGKQKHTYVRWGYRHTYTLSKLNSEEAARLLGGERGGKVWHIIVHMMYRAVGSSEKQGGGNTISSEKQGAKP